MRHFCFCIQVTLHSKPHSECFECNPTSAASKTYATCTIRNTPDQPVHCIVWAKHIVAALFGSKDDSNLMADFKLYDAEPGMLAKINVIAIFLNYTDVFSLTQPEQKPATSRRTSGNWTI